MSRSGGQTVSVQSQYIVLVGVSLYDVTKLISSFDKTVTNDGVTYTVRITIAWGKTFV